MRTQHAENIFSFRAECEHDIRLLFEAMMQQGYRLKRTVKRGIMPDVSVEIRTSATQQEVIELLSQIPDSHVMIQTLRPVLMKDNSMERDWQASL